MNTMKVIADFELRIDADIVGNIGERFRRRFAVEIITRDKNLNKLLEVTKHEFELRGHETFIRMSIFDSASSFIAVNS